MSLQKYDIAVGLNKTLEIGAQGKYIYYLSGTTANITAGVLSAAGNQAINVKHGQTGDVIVLMPGQSLRLDDADKSPTSWFLSNALNNEAITGMVLVGEGDFHDSNTSNTVTIAASAITNAQAMPVQKQALSTITDFAVVNINAGAAQALVSDATQRCLRIRNGHATATLYIGGAGVTVAKAAIVLAPGDLWIEEEAAGAAWYATSDTANTNVQIQGLKL